MLRCIPLAPLVLYAGVLLLHCILCEAGPQRKNPDDLKFYIYDWPGQSLGWIGEDKWIKSSVYYHGYGQPVDESKGLFETNQYSLYKIMIQRALTDPRRTTNPREASAFLIPYDMGYDAAIKLERGIWPNHCVQSTDIERRLNASEFYRRSGGKDHIMIFSINFSMDFYITEQCHRFLSQVCATCIKFCVDDYSFLYGGILEKANPLSPMVGKKGLNWRAVPFPSDVHWNSKMTRPFPWESEHKRKYLVGYGGSEMSYYRHSKTIRQMLVKHCDESPALCHRSYYGSSARNTKLVATNGSSIHDVLNNSIFCLNPPGDLPTRKGLFDSILLGCIPVTFTPLSATAMYTWHWPEEYWKSVVVEIDKPTYKDPYFDVVAYLQKLVIMDSGDISRRQKLIRERAYELQYSYVEPLQDTRPGKDAFDISMHEAMTFAAGLSDGVRNASVPLCGFKCQ
jgi:hypothetical protein